MTGDFRLVAATHQDLEKLVRSGRFREDLYYRINVVPLPIIPLHLRPDDIPYLLKHFLHLYNEKYGLTADFGPEVITHLCRYPWPGNVRELSNLVERLVVTCTEPMVDPSHLPSQYLQRSSAARTKSGRPKKLKEAMDDFELYLIREALLATETREEAAAMLGISLSTLTRRLRKLRKVNPDGQF
jgi:transcriptional regulator with PAS, ATPase and Fis domain